jgi:hypothetical protein
MAFRPSSACATQVRFLQEQQGKDEVMGSGPPEHQPGETRSAIIIQDDQFAIHQEALGGQRV